MWVSLLLPLVVLVPGVDDEDTDNNDDDDDDNDGGTVESSGWSAAPPTRVEDLAATAAVTAAIGSTSIMAGRERERERERERDSKGFVVLQFLFVVVQERKGHRRVGVDVRVCTMYSYV